MKNKFIYSLQLLLAVTILVDYAVGVNINHSLGNWFYVLPIAAFALLNVPMLGDWKIYHPKYIVLFIYHILAALFLVFLTPVFGPYFQLSILLLFASSYWYKWSGLLISFGVQTLLMLAAASYQFNGIDQSTAIALLVRIVILAVIGLLFTAISTRQSSDGEEVELRQSISFERTRLTSLINSMADAVIATNQKGQIVLYNGAALDLLNTNLSLENKYLQTLVTLFDEEGKEVDLITEGKKRDAVLKRDDLHFKGNDDQEINVYASVSPIRSGFTQEGDQGFIFVLRDITKQKTLDEERNEFISVTSHELRTPIAITEANISTALLPNVSGGLNPTAKQLLEQAHHNIIFLGDLVNDLTTLARAERNDLEVEVAKIDPLVLIQGLVQSYTAEANAKGLKLSVDGEAKARPISNSELYVHEILQNFLTNALKYTQKGGVTLAVQSTADGSAIFSVADTGIGIGTSDKKQVFSKFYRAEDFRTRKTRGTGLGLYITMKLAQRIKGRIWFDSVLNKGSTFYLQVPSIAPPRPAPNKAQDLHGATQSTPATTTDSVAKPAKPATAVNKLT